MELLERTYRTVRAIHIPSLYDGFFWISGLLHGFGFYFWPGEIFGVRESPPVEKHEALTIFDFPATSEKLVPSSPQRILEDLTQACEMKGIKLCAALTASGFLATHASKNLQTNQPETYSVITLVDCRQYLDPPLNENHIGFYHSGILNTHTVNGGDGFWDIAIRCHKAVSNAKNNKKHLSDIGELNFLMCKAIENPHLTPSSSLRTALISVFEEPVDYAPMEQLKDMGVEDFLGCASVHGVGASLALFDTIRNGQLDSVCVYPSPLHSREQMEELVENMKRILMESCVVDEGGN